MFFNLPKVHIETQDPKKQSAETISVSNCLTYFLDLKKQANKSMEGPNKDSSLLTPLR